MMKQFKETLLEKHLSCNKCPSNEEVIEFFSDILTLLFPQIKNSNIQDIDGIDQAIEQIKENTRNIISHYPDLCPVEVESFVGEFIAFLPALHAMLLKDVEAIYMEDPAAKSKNEIIRCYPGFYAIAAYRLAHQLDDMNILIIPRIITEHAHAMTGADIHPSAEIGSYFCIDHATGVVIGETSHIGHHVKIYQGVTLGALSVEKEDADKKRHPTIEDHVVIYANATILGGNTVIGERSTIGGNVWITDSINPDSLVHYQAEKKIISKQKI